MSLVALPSLDNPAVNVFVESTNVAALEAIPTGGTRISLNRGASETTAGPFVDVTGTPAAIAAALTAGSAAAVRVLGVAAVSGAGALLGAFGTLVGAGTVQNGPGDYTITPVAPFPAGTIIGVSSISGGPEIVAADGPSGATQDVKSFDAAGVAADASFVLVAYGPPL